MKKFKEYIGEAFFKVKIPDVAPTFVEAGSASEVKTNMRKVLKPDVVTDLEIERITPAAMKKMYRDMAQGKDEVEEEHINEATDITKYSPSDLKSVFSKFLYMDDSRAGKESGNLKGSDNRILPDDKQLPTALYMTITGPDKSGSFLYPKGSYYVGFSRVNADGEVVMAFAGTARLVTYELDDAKQYIKKFSNLSLIKKQMDKGNKGFGAWPATYDLTGDFKGQGKGSKIIKIDSMDEIKY